MKIWREMTLRSIWREEKWRRKLQLEINERSSIKFHYYLRVTLKLFPHSPSEEKALPVKWENMKAETHLREEAEGLLREREDEENAFSLLRRKYYWRGLREESAVFKCSVEEMKMSAINVKKPIISIIAWKRGRRRIGKRRRQRSKIWNDLREENQAAVLAGARKTARRRKYRRNHGSKAHVTKHQVQSGFSCAENLSRSAGG